MLYLQTVKEIGENQAESMFYSRALFFFHFTVPKQKDSQRYRVKNLDQRKFGFALTKGWCSQLY